MLIRHPCAFPLHPQIPLTFQFARHAHCFPPFPTVAHPKQNYARTSTSLFVAKQNHGQKKSAQNVQIEIEEDKENGNDYDDDDVNEFSSRSGFRGREEEKDYDRDPEFAEILGSCLDDPQKARSKVSLKNLFSFFFFLNT